MIRAFVEERFAVRVHNEQRERRYLVHWCWLAEMERPAPLSAKFPTLCRRDEGDDRERRTSPRSGPPPCSFGAAREG